MTGLDDVIARLEQATGPDGEIDLEIARLQNAVVMRRNYEDSANEEYTHWRYTASIDAALTLVPEGMRRRTIVYENGRAGVQLWWPTDPLPAAWGTAYASEPIATVIAALRGTKGSEG